VTFQCGVSVCLRVHTRAQGKQDIDVSLSLSLAQMHRDLNPSKKVLTSTQHAAFFASMCFLLVVYLKTSLYKKQRSTFAHSKKTLT
jgi:hypothetical protein